VDGAAIALVFNTRRIIRANLNIIVTDADAEVWLLRERWRGDDGLGISVEKMDSGHRQGSQAAETAP
jgi:hypothetical protein